MTIEYNEEILYDSMRGIWKCMVHRCSTDVDKPNPYYAGRGIKVHPEWVESFEAFANYIGLRPSFKHSLDRIDNKGNYEPGNVRWATLSVQANNKKKFSGPIPVTVDGVRYKSMLTAYRLSGRTMNYIRDCLED